MHEMEQPVSATDLPRGRAWFHGLYGFSVGGKGALRNYENHEMSEIEQPVPATDFTARQSRNQINQNS
jgi:hypothetical protein